MATTTTVSRPPAPSTVLYPGSALYIGNLHSDITEAILFEKFSTAGPVLSIRVCRDMITRRSLGYGYINYQNAADAERALDTMNFDVMKGKQIRLMWSQRDPSLRKSGVGNIFMKNLDTSIDNKALYDTFSAFGNILSCKVATDEAGNSKGYGFVHFETEEGAGQAIKKVNGMLLNGKKVFVGKFIPRLQRSHEQGEKVEKFNNVFVKNFGDELDEAKMCEMFSKFGKIVSSRLMMDGEGKSKGFGFVAFETPESAECAVQGINGLELNGNTLFCGPAMTKARRQVELKKKFEALKAERENRCHGVNLYVKNLDDTIDDDRLVKEFSAFGTIASFKIMTDEEGRSKGFGFVCFTSPEEATRAVTELNGRIIGTKPLYVALAQRKEERKAHLATQYMQRLANMRMQRVPHPGYSLRPNGAVVNASPLFVPPSTRFLPPSIPQQFGPPPRWSMAGQPTPLRGPSGPYQPPSFIPGAASLRPRISMQSTRPTYRMNYPGRASAGGPLISTPPVVGMSDRSAGGLDVGHRHHTPAFQSTSTSGLSYQYTSSARNAVSGSQPQQQAVPPRQPPPEPAVVIEGQEPLTSSMLVAAPVEQQKQMLGERLYPIIRSFFPEHAGKITGMLLEIDNSELLHLLENPPIMEAKIREANTVLQFHMDKRAGAGAASSKNRG